MLTRRRRLPPHLEPAYRAFAAAADELERAKEELLRAIPGARAPGVPLAEALLAFRGGLDATGAAMPAWRAREVEHEWRACADGLAEARAREEALRLAAPELSHEALLAALGDLIEPLEPFATAARAFADLRAR